MHGLDPCIQGRHGMIINEGAAWMPGSEAGHDERRRKPPDSVVLGGALEGGISLKRRRRSFLDFSFGKAKYVLPSDDVASEIPIHRARLTRRNYGA